MEATEQNPEGGEGTETPVETEVEQNSEPETRTEPGPRGDDTPVDRPSRRDRKAARLDVEAAERRAQEAQRERDAERAERARMAEQIAELRGRITERESSREPEDKYAPQIDTLEAEAQRHLQNVANSKDPAYQQAEMKAYHAKMREAAKLDWKRDQEAEAKKRGPQQAPNHAELARNIAITTALDADYPTLSTDARFRARADLHLDALVAEGHNGNSLTTLRLAVARAAQDLNIRGTNNGNAAPSSAQRARYTGVPGGDAGGGGPEAPKFKNDEAEHRLAMLTFPKDTPERAYVKWKKTMLERMGTET